jgi:SAM-dependent methyltransferase
MRTPTSLHLRYDVERRLADRIRAAAPQDREAVALDAYESYFRSFAAEAVSGEARMGATRHKEAFVRAAFAGRRRILEVGCGYGATLASLAADGRTLAGIELSPQLVGEARRRAPGIEFLCRSAVRFDPPGEPFDAAYSIDFLEHVHPDDAPAHFASVHRCLADRGCYLVMTPHAATGPHDISKFFDRTPTGFHLKEYRYAEVVRLGRAAGFRRFRSPALPFRCGGGADVGLARVPAAWKVAIEVLLGPLPRSRLKTLLFNALALQTVCVLLEKCPAPPRGPRHEPVFRGSQTV